MTKVLEHKLQKYPDAEVYACGPMPMLGAVHTICANNKTPLQVSLEESMACGVGACLGCVVKGAGHTEEKPSYLCSCKVGPVFKSQYLDWSALENNNNDCGGCA